MTMDDDDEDGSGSGICVPHVCHRIISINNNNNTLQKVQRKNIKLQIASRNAHNIHSVTRIAHITNLYLFFYF